MSFEFKTKTSDALLVYTDDGGVHGNASDSQNRRVSQSCVQLQFYAVTIVDGHIQMDFR